MFKKHSEDNGENPKKVKIQKPKKEKKAKIRDYDENFKYPVDKKKIFTILGLILVAVLLAVVIIVAIQFFEKINKDPAVTPPPIILTEEEEYAKKIKDTLSNGYLIGSTTKQELLDSGTIDSENSGEEYLIKSTYTTIDDKEYFTTYLLKDDVLVGIVHEAILDTTSKYKLATEFQYLTSSLNKVYSQIEISQRWFSDSVKYDSEVWNNLIMDNKLELVAELAKDSEFVKVVASGVPYFNYLYNNRYDQSFGNLDIIYSNGAHQDLFKQIDAIDFNK